MQFVHSLEKKIDWVIFRQWSNQCKKNKKNAADFNNYNFDVTIRREVNDDIARDTTRTIPSNSPTHSCEIVVHRPS